MGRRRDKFWEHAEELIGEKRTRFRCNYCESEFGGGATRIKYHLSRKGGDIQMCPKVPQDVRLAAALAIDHDHLQATSTNNKTKKKKKKKKSIASSSSQTEIGHDQMVVDTKLAKFMFLHDIPFVVAEAPLFDQFVKCVADFASSHQQPPSRSREMTLRRLLEHDIPKQIEEYTKHAEDSLPQTGCTLISNSYYDFLYAWTSKGLVFKGKLPYDEAMEDAIDEKWFSSTIELLGPNHILQVILVDVEFAEEVITGYPWVCVTHCATQEMIYSSFRLGIPQCCLITSASLVFLYMKKNHPDLVSLRESDTYSNAQSSSIIALASDALNHFSESDLGFIMGFLRLKLLLECEDKLHALQLPVQWGDDEKDSRFFYHAIKHKEFWKRGKQVLHAIQPVFEAFCLLVTNHNVTVGYLYQLMERAKNLIQGLHCCHGNCVVLVFNRMYERLIRPIHAVAALLNPAYLCDENFNQKNKDLKEGTDFILENFVPKEERADFMKQLLAYKSKDPKLFTASARALLNSSHPGVWWEYCGDCVPVLQKYALKIVSQPCSSFLTSDELHSITSDDSIDKLKSKILMMEKSVMEPKPHIPSEATKLVDQLAAFPDMEPHCSSYDRYFQNIPSLDDEYFWDSLDNPSNSFLDVEQIYIRI